MTQYVRMAKELYEAFPEVPSNWVYGFICENYLVGEEKHGCS